MAKNRRENRTYPSRYSPDVDKDGIAWVTGRQYIVEMICENKAAKEHKELPRGFYTKDLDLKGWQKFYQEQINNRSLTKLINNHTVEKLVAFLRENKYIISLRPKWVHLKIEEYNYKAPSVNKDDVSYDFGKKEKFVRNNTKKSIISRLEELE